MTSVERLKELAEKAQKAKEKINGPETLGPNFAILQEDITAFHCAINPTTILSLIAERDEARNALERIALLDEADGHELRERHAFEAVAIATSTLGKHPSEIYADRFALKEQPK